MFSTQVFGQVLCNGGVAMEITLVHLVVLGSSNSPIDFTHFPAASWFGLSVLGAIACSTGDTWQAQAFFPLRMGSGDVKLCY